MNVMLCLVWYDWLDLGVLCVQTKDGLWS